MLKKALLALCCAAVVAGVVSAQERQALSAEQRAAAMAQSLDKRVGGLTDEQKAKATEIYLKQINDVTAVAKDTSLTAEQRKEKYAAIHKAAQEAINALLTPEQKAKMPALPKPEVGGKERDRLVVTEN